MTATDTQSISIDAYDYPLPQSRIAAHPEPQRDSCRLLVRHADGSLADRLFSDLPGLLPQGAMMVCNNTRVVNARLRFARRGGEGARIEVFCLEPVSPADYQQAFASYGPVTMACFVGNSKKWKPGEVLTATFGDNRLIIEARRVGQEGRVSLVEFAWRSDEPMAWGQVLDLAGEIPIPPYLNRDSEQADLSDYQTVFGRIEGSVAAPTAGLHFTPELLDALDASGIERREVTLHVGAGTFQPVKSDTIGGHEMHAEFFTASLPLIEELAATSRPVVAVGTTSVRTLESIHHLGRLILQGHPADELPQWAPYEGPDATRAKTFAAVAERLRAAGKQRLTATTRLMIAPGYKFRAVDAMVTNFHQPRSTLLLLVDSFMGSAGGGWRAVYDHALANPAYRFLSYGDACLLL